MLLLNNRYVAIFASDVHLPSCLMRITVCSALLLQVYHWDISESHELASFVFERFQSLRGDIVLSYQVSEDSRWCLLCTVAVGSFDGSMQLFSVDKKASQVVPGHAGWLTNSSYSR